MTIFMHNMQIQKFHPYMYIYVSLSVPGPTQLISVGYKSESNNANDSKKEDLSQQVGI